MICPTDFSIHQTYRLIHLMLTPSNLTTILKESFDIDESLIKISYQFNLPKISAMKTPCDKNASCRVLFKGIIRILSNIYAEAAIHRCS